MSLGIKVVKGMKDLLPDELGAWYHVEGKLKSLALSYGYQEIRMPLLEQTDLFKRAIGEVTDIVEKEMYTFIDKGGESLTLRPEGTAQSVRLMLENNMLRNQSQRVWYQGPMFRRENPQKARYRQFYQFGVEAFGLAGPDVDVEQILMISRLWRDLGIEDKISLQINSLGTKEERATYRDALIHYFKGCALDEDSQRRLHTNPLRILDSKNPMMQEAISKAPILLDYLGEGSLGHFTSIQNMLRALNIAFQVNPRMVRGLDYYTHFVYEWVTTHLGSQGTVCAGGRYDDLVALLGGPAIAAVGFALGIERLIMLLQDNDLIPSKRAIDVYIVADEGGEIQAFALAEKLRNAIPGLRVQNNCGGGSFKSQFKRADKSGALIALILGEEELSNNTVSRKHLRADVDIPQMTMTREDVIQDVKLFFINHKD